MQNLRTKPCVRTLVNSMPDEVQAELFKAGGETVLDRKHKICVAIRETGEWPQELTFSKFISLPKKSDLQQCANYRTIALVSQASMILLTIILHCESKKQEPKLLPITSPNVNQQNSFTLKPQCISPISNCCWILYSKILSTIIIAGSTNLIPP